TADSRTDVPEVVGQPADVAEGTLTEAGFVVAREEERSDSVEAGVVIRTDPAENTRIADGSTVTIVVSSGAELVRVAQVEGLTDLGATQDLEALGLTVRSERVEDTSVPAGIVLSQSPVAGTEVESGSAVILQISEGSELIALPDVSGLERDAAEAVLVQLLGCTVTDVRNEASAEVTAGLVARTEPEAGTGIDEDTCFVTLIMSTGAGAQDPTG
ncbi:MAG: PASTA domain-containing protein, partial [Actinomycetota bacterium]